MKVAFIIRGVPGSGKSTLAKKLAGDGGIVHSTDNYFSVNGEYRFDPEKLSAYHDLNHAAFCRSLREGIDVVVCDNTNAKRWQFEPYAQAAQRAGYVVAFVVMPHPNSNVAARRTIHNVPAHVIERMIEEWENV